MLWYHVHSAEWRKAVRGPVIHSVAPEGRERSCSSRTVLRPASIKGDVRFQKETLTIMINLFPKLTNTSELVDATARL